MSDTDDKDGDKNGSNGKLLSFPGGEKVDTKEVGVDFVVGQGGDLPTTELIDPRFIEREIRKRENFVSSQKLVRVIAEKAPVSDVVDAVLNEIAEELSHLKYERRKATEEGKNTANYTISRIASLRQLADVLQKRQENTRAERLDLQSPRFKQVLHLWMEFVYDSMSKADLPESTIDVVFKQMEADMQDWEKKLLEVAG
jgi:hypothetical protein